MNHARFALPSRPLGGAPGGLRSRMRAATASAHERMHAHSGFAAAAAGEIGSLEYRQLLARLFGFHEPFEVLARQAASTVGVGIDLEGRARTPSLLADLESLGLDQDAIARLPRWIPPHSFASEGSLIGALYVLEGSTLGGIQIARALKVRFGDETGEGRRFFLGRGNRQSAMWRDFVERLEALSERPEQAALAIVAAVSTFEQFESWMAGWKG
jgi:heme oxygenase